VPQDLGEAARLFRLAAEQQFPQSQYALGKMLIAAVPVDEGVPTEPRAGAKLLARVVQYVRRSRPTMSVVLTLMGDIADDALNFK
jgi:hypothetical protein